MQFFAAPPRDQQRRPHEPATAGGRELGLAARPPARFNSLRSEQIVNQEPRPSGNTLLAQRYPSPGNSYFWHTAPCGNGQVLTQGLFHAP